MITITPTACGGDTHTFSVHDESTGAKHEVVRVYGDNTAQMINEQRLEKLTPDDMVALIRRLMLCCQYDEYFLDR